MTWVDLSDMIYVMYAWHEALVTSVYVAGRAGFLSSTSTEVDETALDVYCWRHQTGGDVFVAGQILECQSPPTKARRGEDIVFLGTLIVLIKSSPRVQSTCRVRCMNGEHLRFPSAPCPSLSYGRCVHISWFDLFVTSWSSHAMFLKESFFQRYESLLKSSFVQ
jgi:hypothetical protein